MTIKPGFQTLVINLLGDTFFAELFYCPLDGVSAKKLASVYCWYPLSSPNLICILKPPMLLQFDQRKFSQLKGGQVRLTKLKYLIDKKQRVIYIKRRRGRVPKSLASSTYSFLKSKGRDIHWKTNSRREVIFNQQQMECSALSSPGKIGTRRNIEVRLFYASLGSTLIECMFLACCFKVTFLPFMLSADKDPT